MFTVSYLLWYSQWRVFLCYNRRWLGLASMWPRYSCSDHLYLVNGLTVKNSAKYSAFVSNFDGNCIVYWIAVHSSELQQKIEHSAVVLKVVMCTVLCTAVVWFGYIWNIVALGKYMRQRHKNMNMFYRDLRWYDLVFQHVHRGAFGAVSLFQHSCIPCWAAVSMLGEIRWNWLENPITTSQNIQPLLS